MCTVASMVLELFQFVLATIKLTERKITDREFNKMSSIYSN